MKALDFRDRWVVVTGASSGLGEQLARRLASHHRARLILVARRRERLAALQEELRAAHGTEVVLLPMDLAAPDAAERIFTEATRERQVYAVISNAAAYWFGEFTAMPEPQVEQLLQVNVRTPLLLLRRFLPYLDQRGEGGILVITSTGAMMPTPRQALYGGTKALLQGFVESLHHERTREREHVPVCLCSPGGMLTEMLVSSPVLEQLRRRSLITHLMMRPEVVARRALHAFRRRRFLTVPGLRNQLMVLLAKVLPARSVGEGAARIYGSR
ncbi:SDR family NAD(P)-dependent oxidoreductase [Archangium minus]|uniref:SDR family NAD(P)-dependent oxidoreductase n=1 Tax=Archangium minus TaxID=83450 RepID=A0ABY9X4M2_9BACT|nr:SDR family NAD(P)-dependent oxidoreductase [Archangium minus]